MRVESSSLMQWCCYEKGLKPDGSTRFNKPTIQHFRVGIIVYILIRNFLAFKEFYVHSSVYSLIMPLLSAARGMDHEGLKATL